MEQEPHIVFQIQRFDNDGAWGDIVVFAEGILLMRSADYPLTILADQLAEWSGRVDDISGAAAFIMRVPGHPDFTGTFRVEPRPHDWQFTSILEMHRHQRLFPLASFKHMITRFADELNDATKRKIPGMMAPEERLLKQHPCPRREPR